MAIKCITHSKISKKSKIKNDSSPKNTFIIEIEDIKGKSHELNINTKNGECQIATCATCAPCLAAATTLGPCLAACCTCGSCALCTSIAATCATCAPCLAAATTLGPCLAACCTCGSCALCTPLAAGCASTGTIGTGLFAAAVASGKRHLFLANTLFLILQSNFHFS